ncbi:MAG: PqqD family protein [Acidimicrobiia bacterium]
MTVVPRPMLAGVTVRRLAADAIRPASRIRSVMVSEMVTTGGQVVLYVDGAVHLLSPTAALVWQSCEDDVTVATLAQEFAVSFGVAYEDVLTDVLASACDLVERGLVVPATAHRAPETDETLPILQPLPACSGCGEGPTYERHVIVDLGDLGVSIGADAEVADGLAAALGPRSVRIETAPTDRASYGLVVPSDGRDRERVALARLHRGPDVLLTSRDPMRVLRAVFAQIAIHSPTAGSQLLEGMAVGRDGRVVVMPAPANRVGFERSAAELGLSVSDSSMVMVQVTPLQVIIGAPDLGVDFGPLEELASARRSLSEPALSLPWGCHELVGIAVNGSPDAAAVIGELGPRLGTSPTGGTPLTPLLALADVVRVERGTSAADIDRLLRTT